MIKPVLLFFFLLMCFGTGAQPPFQDSVAKRRTTLIRANMTILGGWSVANIGTGFIAAGQTQGEAHYFNQMNGYWGMANLLVAVAGMAGAKKELAGPESFERNLKEQHRLEKIVVFNGGLDIAYLMTGFYLRERGARLGKDDLRGYGSSFFLQGGFLMAFDIFQYLRYRQTGRMLENKAGWQVTAGLGGLKLIHPL